MITGPTASGKTALSIQLAQAIGAEIVNADSMQIYKYMDIGTAKPTREERGETPHHLIDIAEPNEQFSVARYCDLAKEAIDRIHSANKPAVMVGGTGLYVDSVVNNIQFSKIEPDEEYRRKLFEIAEEKGNEYIYEMLLKADPESASKIKIPDRKRIIRALEVYHKTGKTLSWHNQMSRSVPSPYNIKMFAIRIERDVLYERINSRVDEMIKAGLLDEVKNLLNMGIDRKCTSMQAIGYKETAEYLNGEISFDEAVYKIKIGSRHYAKRQITWFGRNERIKRINGIDELLLNLN